MLSFKNFLLGRYFLFIFYHTNLFLAIFVMRDICEFMFHSNENALYRIWKEVEMFKRIVTRISAKKRKDKTRNWVFND